MGRATFGGAGATIRRFTELSPAEKASLTEAIAAQIRPFKADLEIGSERELHTIASNTRIKLIDLNGDGIAEVLAQANGIKAGCGATGNCPFWIQETARYPRQGRNRRHRAGHG
jgi:hypothetical protein